MRIQRWMKWTVAAAVACGLAATVLVHTAHAAAPVRAQISGDFPRHGRLLEKLTSLGITDEQRSQIKTIIADAKPKATPLVKQFVTERRAMRELILNGAGEQDVRAQAAKVARVATDLAVLRAQVAPKIRAVLTPEQQAKLKEMIANLDAHVDAAVEHIGHE